MVPNAPIPERTLAQLDEALTHLQEVDTLEAVYKKAFYGLLSVFTTIFLAVATYLILGLSALQRDIDIIKTQTYPQDERMMLWSAIHKRVENEQCPKPWLVAQFKELQRRLDKLENGK
jgi:hypothetical protein